MSNALELIGAPDPADAGDVELNADQRAVLAKDLSDQMFGFKHIIDLLKAGKPVQRGLLRSVLYMAEARIVDACKVSGIQLDSATEQEQRYARVRALNERVRELEAQLGQAATPEQTAAHLKVCAENLNKWWRADGFGHVRDVTFTDWGHMKAELSCHLFGDFSLTMSKTPVSDKERRAQWLQDLKDRGFVLVQDDRDLELLDCDQNRKTITELVMRAIPSARVVSTENIWKRGGQMLLRSVSIFIDELGDVHTLRPTREEVAEDL